MTYPKELSAQEMEMTHGVIKTCLYKHHRLQPIRHGSNPLQPQGRQVE